MRFGNFYNKIVVLYILMFGVFFVQCGTSSVSDVNPKPPIEESNPPTDEQTEPDSNMDLYGFILGNNGEAISEVVVSDGYSCTITNKKGFYQMKRNDLSTMVFYSTPSNYEINTTSESLKMASFYTALTPAKEQYNFTLKKLPAIEKDFTLLCIADPQVRSDESFNRFRKETMVDIQSYVLSQTTPSYGLFLGDIVQDRPRYFNQMRTTMGSSDMIAHTTIGNHDKIKTSNPQKPRSSKEFSEVFGPLNYSFNRGDVHFICLDNIIFTDANTYIGGLSDEQIHWLKQDLSYVPKSKMIIVYYHKPMREHNNINRKEMLSLLRGYKEVHLMAGHTHYNENFMVKSPISAYEHIHGAACGSFWHSTINSDGTPNGYGIYHISGSTIKEWYYKATNYNKDFQMRLHKGDESFGGPFAFFDYGQLDNTIVANVWNSDDKWKIEAYEDDVKVTELTPLKSLNDAWAFGYHVGVLGLTYKTPNKHAYLHTMLNPEAKLEIKAIDRFGNVYSEIDITSGFSSAASY